MTPEMQAELLKRLDALATKVGTTGEHLWTVLVAQARIDAIQYIIGAILVLLAAIVVAYIGTHIWKSADGFNDGKAWGIFLWFAASIGFAAAAALATDSLTPLLNPEYWAFKEILRLVK